MKRGINTGANMPSLEELVISNATKDEIKDVPPIPTGTYLALVAGPHEMIKSSRKGTPGIEFTLRLLQAMDDVDRDDLETHLGAAGRKLADITMKHTIWDSPYAAQALRDFVYDSLTIDEQLPIKQALSEAPGRNVLVSITHRPMQSADGMARLQAQINSTAKAD
jgi:hypothetical protein